MTWSRTLQLAPQKFDKLASTYGQNLSYARHGPNIKNFIYYFLCLEFYCVYFEPKNKAFSSFLVILMHENKNSF
jgi:hypothetical protein